MVYVRCLRLRWISNASKSRVVKPQHKAKLKVHNINTYNPNPKIKIYNKSNKTEKNLWFVTSSSIPHWTRAQFPHRSICFTPVIVVTDRISRNSKAYCSRCINRMVCHSVWNDFRYLLHRISMNSGSGFISIQMHQHKKQPAKVLSKQAGFAFFIQHTTCAPVPDG